MVMAPTVWIVCFAWIGAALAAAGAGARRGLREGRGRRVAARMKSPTVYLFAAYLMIAGLASPTSSGESSSPLLWLAIVLPSGYALASLSAIGRERRSAAARA